MQKSDPLVRTKLCPPFIRPGLVMRPRLQEQIEQGLRGPLTLIVAPAGFGKTTLAATSVAGCGMSVAWLSLDKSDNHVGHFAAYLIASLQGVDHRIGIDASQFTTGIQQALPEAVLASLINDLAAVDREIVLVLDDYQFISSQAVHTQVAFLLEHCPRSFHLLIATRSDPPLPIARLRARAQVIELRSADLRFTTDEAVQFLNDVMGLHLDAGAVGALEERTEGWIAGLQMAALSMRDRTDVRGFIEGFSGTNRFILEYLLEEILSSQSADIQHFLLRTSILERLTAPLCDALLKNVAGSEFRDDDVTSHAWPASDSASILRYLERENLFLVSLDDQRIWFRYHHLFADLLRARLNQTQPSMEHILHVRASTWLEQNGFIPEAIQHLFSAHEMDQAAELIERYVAIRWAESDPSVALMAESLPTELLITRPKMAFYYAWYLILQGSVEKAIPLLRDIEQQLVLADRNSGQGWIQTLVGLAQAFLASRSNSSDLRPLPDYQILDEIPLGEFILRDTAEILYGMALGRRGQIDRAAELAYKIIQKGKTHQRALAIPPLVPLLARIYLMQGRLHAAASLCREYLDPLKEKGIRFIYSAGGMNVFLGEVLYEWNCLEEAERQVREGLHANEPWVDIMTDAWGLLALTRVLRAKADYAAALQYVDKLERRLQGHLRPREFDEDFHTLRVRVELASGNLPEAIKWAEQIRQSEDFHSHKERYQLTLSRIYFAQGKYTDAEEILNPMPSRPTGGNQITRQIEYNLLLATAIAEQQRLPKALGLVESCLALAEPEGYIQIFLDVGGPTRKLLKAYLRSAAPVHKLYAQKLLYAFSPAEEVSSPDYMQNELLSQRELEVLQLMSLGKTNLEISEQLIVARGTIKAHAASIYRKLDATNRTEAVARARQLGILS